MEIRDLRVGQGFDVHKFKEGRKLVLCGENIDYKYGLDGHSDADVAVHALMDALLGAAGKRDIGYYFPDNDNKFKDIDSMLLLSKTIQILNMDGWKISNIDLTVIAEKPKLSPFIEKMKENLSKILELSIDRISLKATTTEKLGFTGRKEGIASISSVLLIK